MVLNHFSFVFIFYFFHNVYTYLFWCSQQDNKLNVGNFNLKKQRGSYNALGVHAKDIRQEKTKQNFEMAQESIRQVRPH